MATNFIQPGDTVSLTAPYDVASGAGFKVGGIFAVALATALSGAAVEAKRTGLFELAKANSESWAQGDIIYWDNSAKKCTKTSTGNKRIGAAMETEGSDDTTGKVLLVPETDPSGSQQAANVAALTFGTNITAATANGALTDSSATNPTEAQFNELAKELGTKVNAVIAALIAAGLMASS